MISGYAVEALPPRYRLDRGNLLRLPGGDVLAGLKPRASGLSERYLRRLLELATDCSLSTLPVVGDRWLHLDTVVGVFGPGRFHVYRDGLRGGLPTDGPLADGRREMPDIAAVASVSAIGREWLSHARRVTSLGRRSV